ncbi:MAG: hypothetical protein Q7R81_02090 [Candidatus Peregrinibacteria bacterium]|nr:hypothetical protein [Candidatus Peregrinibacteria bacterium]
MRLDLASLEELRGRWGKLLTPFWNWYERHYLLNVSLTAALFSLQLIHLYWLTTDVVAFRLFGERYFSPTPFWQYIIIIVDYTEIPTLLSTSALYLYELQRGKSWTPLLFLILLNSQWIHLFWITDEFVLRVFEGISDRPMFPGWLAWIAICIDYLEIPVIIDTFVRVYKSLKDRRFRAFLKEEARYHIWHI